MNDPGEDGRSASAASARPSRDEPPGRRIFIGDVHGCVDELDELIGELKPRSHDRLFFVGDLVDHGPDSAGAIQRVRELLGDHPGSASVMGNHEEKWLRYRERGRELPPAAARLDEEDWRFLDGLPLIVRVPELGVIVVHGGFFPAFFEAYGRIGEVAADWRTARDKKAERLRRFLRVREIDDRGNYVSLEDLSPHNRHWTEAYDGREGYCFFGHDPQLSPPRVLRTPHATGLDTGCCFGGALTAAVVGPGEAPAGAGLVSAPSRGPYARPRFARSR